MRKFWLELVGIDSAIDLNGGEAIIGAEVVMSATALYLTRTSKAIVLTEPSGLGFEMHSPASAVGMGYVDTHDELLQPRVAGMLNFTRRGSLDPYGSYSTFTRLIDMYPTRLRYDPTGSGYDNAYLLPGKVTKLTKSEIKASRLAVGMEFSASEPFYKIAAKTGANGAAISLAANTALDMTPSSGELSGYKNAFTITITLTAAAASGLTAKILRSSDSKLLAELELSNTMQSGDVISWSSDPESPRVVVNGQDPILSGWINLAKDLYPALKAENMTFKCSKACTASISYKAYRRSV